MQLRLLVLVAFGSLCGLLPAQTIEIKLIDGRSGHPVSNTWMNVWVGNEHKDPLVVSTDKKGVAHLRLTNNDGEVDTQNRCKDCGDAGIISTVVKYHSSISVQAGYVWCRPKGSAYSWLAINEFPTEQLVRQGIVTGNTCGKPIASPRPGELIIFVRPMNFWETLKQ